MISLAVGCFSFSVGLAFLSRRITEYVVKRMWCDTLYENSFYLQQITVFFSFLTLLITNFALFTLIGQEHLKFIVLLSSTLVYGFYLTFHSIILTIFERKYQNLLSSRYRIEAKTTLDEALYANQNGSISYHVAFLVTSQLNKAKRVVFPIGCTFLIIAVFGVMYIPLLWVKGLMVGSLLAVISSILPWISLLPSTLSNSQKNNLKMSAVRCSPALIFPVIFTMTTPLLIDFFYYSNSELFQTYL